MPTHITNKDTRALNKYPPDGSDMGIVRKGTRVDAIGTNGRYTGYKLLDGKFRCVPTIDLDPVGITPPPVEPPLPSDAKIYRVSELVNNVWVDVGYFQQVDSP